MSEVVHHVPPGNHIPAALQPFSGPAGWACTTTTAAADIASYGFLNLGTNCGTVH